MSGLRFEIDRSLCQGHNRCAALAPDAFAIDDDGYGEVLDDGEVPDDLIDAADDIVGACPEQAILLRRDPR
jgi:ferredoxin